MGLELGRIALLLSKTEPSGVRLYTLDIDVNVK